MKRQLKFRAWDKLQKKMINPVPFSEQIAIQLGGVVGLFNGKTYDTVNDEFELMQFTGIIDIKGKEIYEGDIVSGNDGRKYKVVFFEGGFLLEGHTNTLQFVCDYFKLKVIGNIYENPTLPPIPHLPATA